MDESIITPHPFRQLLPECQLFPVVVSSPHSGNHYPADFLAASRLGKLAIRRSEDFLVDQLAGSAVSHGLPILASVYPRAYLDLNREPYELDPSMLDGPIPDFANCHSIRVSGGLGTIPRVVAEGEPIYNGKIPISSVLERINAIYKPYHEALQNLLAHTHVRFGTSVLLDFHSMPSARFSGNAKHRPDIVIGDRYGTSCSPLVLHHAGSVFRSLGFDVAINKPYAGGFITQHYGRPQYGLHTLQIEINRALYMDEIHICKNAGFEETREKISAFYKDFLQIAFDRLNGTFPLAAE